MGRKLRFIPPGGALVEVTTRTIQGRYLLRPERVLNEIVVGVLARASERTGVEVCAATFLSNHYHLILWVADAKQLATFMRYFNGNLARELNRLTGWNAKVWESRYHAIVISDEPESQINRLRYVLGQGCKEHLVAKASDWPGVHSVAALINGTPLEGYWFDRTREYEAMQRGEAFRNYEHAAPVVLPLAPLPCWRHLPEEEWRSRVASLVTEIEADAAAERERLGIAPLGVPAIKRQDPLARPPRLKTSRAPDFHAFTLAARKALRQAYAWFVAAYREAAAKLRDGERSAEFPEGSFPPPLPFVEFALAQPP